MAMPPISAMMPSNAVVRQRPEDSRLQPLFLHSSFRTGSTWLWQKLRSAPTTLAYYEIFNEILATLTPAQAKHVDFAAWDSRHPAATPYFFEFIPFVRPEGGVAGFDSRMSYPGFIPPGGPDGELRPDEKIYVDMLIAAAASSRRIPVLSCTRSIGRARAMRRAFGGRTIFLHRNLFHQWASYCWQAEIGNTSFLEGIGRTIASSLHDPFLRSVSEWFDLGGSMPVGETLFQVFLILHLYFHSIAFDAADLVVDVNAVAADRHVRRYVEHELSALIRHEIDLSDVREDCEFTGLSTDNIQIVKDTIAQFVKLIPAASLSPDAIAFLEDTKSRALEEWERFDFFTRRTRFVMTRRIEEAEARFGQQRAAAEGLRAEAERLRLDLAEASRSREAEAVACRDTIERVAGESDGLAQRLSASEAAAGDLAGSLAALAAEHERARDALLAATAERHALFERFSATEIELQEVRSRLDNVAAERDAEREALQAAIVAKDAAALRLSRLDADLQAAGDRHVAICADRDALAQRLATVEADQHDLQARLAAVADERDRSLAEACEAAVRHKNVADLLAETAAVREELQRSLAHAEARRPASLLHRTRALLLGRD